MTKDRNLSFTSWQTGELINKELSDSWPHQKAIDLICPFDNTNLIFAYDEIDKGVYCPNCGIQYSPSQISQEEINQECKDYLSKIPEVIRDLDKNRDSLVSRLKHAESKGLINKANLNEQEKNYLNNIKKSISPGQASSS